VKNIYLIDDHGLVRGGLGKILETSGRLKVVGGANSVEEAIPELEQTQPDLVTLDLQLPGVSGVAAVEAIRQVTPDSRILIISGRLDSVEVRELVAAGVHGYLPKDVRGEELIRAADAILEGEAYFSAKAATALVSGVREGGRLADPGLSPRQLETLRLIEKGKKTNEIAEIMMLSPKTIEKYRGEILRRLDCRNQIEALEKARALNILKGR
jgi:two-component system invasion response regulator UvrY